MNKVRMIVIIAVIAVMSFGTQVFARNGMGPMGMGCAALKNLSAEDQAKVKAEQQAFLSDTETLRTQIQQKVQELRTEMQKTEIDVEKASAIQKEISDLQAQMDQKRLQHHINLKKINSALGSCFMGMKSGMRPGMGGQNCMNCPNCPAASQDSSL